MLWYIIIVVLLLVSLLGIPYLVLIQNVKKEIHAVPKIPMLICEIHGVFPAKYAIKINVPGEGREDLKVDTCIFCYHEKMRAAEKVFKK